MKPHSLINKINSLPPLKSAIFQYISLTAASLSLLKMFFGFLANFSQWFGFLISFSQFNDFRDFILLLILTVLVVLELKELSRNPDARELFVPLHYSLPLVIVSVGVSVASRSADDIVNRLAGGILAFLVFFILDRCWHLLFNKFGFDQGTILAAFVAGLYVHGNRVLGLMFLAFVGANLFYLPVLLVRYRRLDVFDQRLVFIPFIVLAAIFTTTPYYARAEVAYRNLGHEKEIVAIQRFIQGMKAKEKNYSVSATKEPEIFVSYEKSDIPLERVAERYRNSEPRLVFEYWKTFVAQSKAAEGETVEVFTDLNSGYLFVVSPTFYVRQAEPQGAR